MPNQNATNRILSRIQELTQRGLWNEAASECMKLTAAAPREAIGWSYLGMVELQRGQLTNAETALRNAKKLEPNNAAHWSNLSIAVDGLGRVAESEQLARRAVLIDPTNSGLWVNLGTALFNQRKWQEAAEAAHQAIAVDAGNAKAWSNLGAAEQSLGRLAAAQEALERSLALVPGRSNTLVNYAGLLIERGQPQRAVALMHDVLGREPGAAAAWVALGNAMKKLDALDQAASAYRQALSLAPRNRDARFALALVEALLWRLPEAEAQLRDIVADDARFAKAWSQLGVVIAKQGRTEEALPALRQSVEIEPRAEHYHTFLMHLQYANDAEPESLLAEHRKWNTINADPMDAKMAATTFVRGRRPLRLGFVSADFFVHPIGFLGLRVLECLDKSECTIVCYSDRVREDDFTARFRAAADLWRVAAGLTAEELADQIRKDEIDILFDLMGHTGHRLPVFARKPAPVQVTWLGYVGTTGLKAMDYLLADRFHVREGKEAWYSERVLRMPNGYACYGPQADAPDVGPLPAVANGYVTFGCFNNPAKFSPSVLAAWAEILRRTPVSRLLLKYGGLHEQKVQQRIREHFTRRGVAAERIVMEGWSPARELLATYNRVDLALDTQPYSGGLTTCEALWMGVPVITCPGRTFAGRHSVSYLSNAGFPQFIAGDLAGYVELAVDWVTRLSEMAALRAAMREQVRRSPLCDAPRFGSDFLAVLREAWESRTLSPVAQTDCPAN